MNRFRSVFRVLFLMFILQIPLYSDDAERTAKYFQKIRKNEGMLTAFFNGMPKGGDIHHHFSGSIYAESYFDVAVAKNFYLNIETGDTYQDIPAHLANDPNIKHLKAFIDEIGYLPVKLKLITLWSVKDFKRSQKTPDKHFFEAFRKFGPIIKGNEDVFLKEIKRRAILENVQYLETMFLRPDYNKNDSNFQKYTDKYTPILHDIQEKKDINELNQILDEMYSHLKTDLAFSVFAEKHSKFIEKNHKLAKLPDEEEKQLLIRYQNFVMRTDNPSDVFAQIFLCFYSDQISDLIVGTNIVGPEDHPIAVRDYWLHMQMFNYFHRRFPKLKYSLHAGELTIGVLPPEDLSWHIRSAVYDAGAFRIGHGLDIYYEKDCYGILNHMKKNKIPVEINLISNEFILEVLDDYHPFMLYHKAGVPIIITSDDMGVLRTSFTDQFAVLAKRYRGISYKDIKGFIYNSIQYSFLENKEKKRMKEILDLKFTSFEKNISENVVSDF